MIFSSVPLAAMESYVNLPRLYDFVAGRAAPSTTHAEMVLGVFR
jgi:hypothetical protein